MTRTFKRYDLIQYEEGFRTARELRGTDVDEILPVIPDLVRLAWDASEYQDRDPRDAHFIQDAERRFKVAYAAGFCRGLRSLN